MNEYSLSIEQRSFMNNKGEQIKYYDLSTKIAGQTIHLQFKDDDKKLALFLLNNQKGVSK